MSTVSIALVDDHPLMVEAIFSLLSRTEGFEVVATGTTARDVVDICELHQPKVAIVDLSMIGDVYAAIATAIKLAPVTKIIAFTAATGVEPAIRALDAGASGYVLKGSSSRELIQAIASVQGGEILRKILQAGLSLRSGILYCGGRLQKPSSSSFARSRLCGCCCAQKPTRKLRSS
jgi:DNA-binding NarL/FixJ family response regulator